MEAAQLRPRRYCRPGFVGGAAVLAGICPAVSLCRRDDAPLVANRWAFAWIGCAPRFASCIAVIAAIPRGGRFSPTARSLDVVARRRRNCRGSGRTHRRKRTWRRLFEYPGTVGRLADCTRRTGATCRKGGGLVGGSGIGHVRRRSRTVAHPRRCAVRVDRPNITGTDRLLGTDRHGRYHERCDARAAD